MRCDPCTFTTVLRRTLVSLRFRKFRAAVSIAVAALALSACARNPPPEALAPAPVPEMPASIRPEEVVGRWGYGAYHNEADRTRTEAAARGGGGHTVGITSGPHGGVVA